MKLNIFQIGKDPISELSSYNKKLIERLAPWQKVNEESFKDQKSLLKKLPQEKDCSIFTALEVKGNILDDDQWLGFYKETILDNRVKSISFLIGEANGISPELSNLCQKKVSLGKITLSHGLAKTVLLENLYRVISRFNKHPFHKA